MPVSLQPMRAGGAAGTRTTTRWPQPAVMASEAAASAATNEKGLSSTKTILLEYVFKERRIISALGGFASAPPPIHFFLDFQLKQSYKGDTTALSDRVARNLM